MVAGPLVAHLGYRWLFLVPAAITSAAFLLTWACVPASTRSAPSPIPLVPAGLLSIGVLCLLLAISCGGTWGWSSTRFLSVAIAGPLLIVLWMAWEVRTSRPFIDLAMLSYRPILAGNALTLLAGFCTFASFAFTPQFLQTSPAHGYGFGATVTQSGFILLPCAAASFLSGFFVGSLAQRLGFRPTLIAGALLMSSAFLSMVLWHQQAWQVIASTTAQGFSSGMILAACATLIVLSVPPGASATASSINANLRTLGGAAGTAILAAILSSSARAGGVPSEFGYVVAYSVLAVAMLAAAGAAIAVPALSRPPQIRPG